VNVARACLNESSGCLCAIRSCLDAFERCLDAFYPCLDELTPCLDGGVRRRTVLDSFLYGRGARMTVASCRNYDSIRRRTVPMRRVTVAKCSLTVSRGAFTPKCEAVTDHDASLRIESGVVTALGVT